MGQGERGDRRASAHFLRGALTVLLLVGAQWGFDKAYGRRSLGLLEPWGQAFQGPALSADLSAVEIADLDLLEPGEQRRFLGATQRALLSLADYLNRLRRIGVEALYQPSGAEQATRFHAARLSLERFLSSTQAGQRALFGDQARFALRQEDGQYCALDLSGFGAWLEGLGPEPLGKRATTERSLAALDHAYYRLVALYRHVTGLLPQA
jgi:hypothetical protein